MTTYQPTTNNQPRPAFQVPPDDSLMWRFTQGANYEIGGPLAASGTYRGERNVLRIWPVERDRKGHTTVWGWEIYFRSLNAGLDRQNETIAGSTFSGRLAAVNGLDHRWGNTLCLAPFVQTDAAPDPTGADVLSYSLVGDVHVFGAGSGANVSLEFTTDSGNPSIAPYTYSPGAVINNVTGAVLAGVGSAERLVVLRRGANAPQVLSDLTNSTPTVDGTMHSDLNDAWGWVTTPLNATTPGAGTHIIQAGNAFRTLSTTAAIGDQPAVSLTQIPDGGYDLGYLDIPGERRSAYFLIPYAEHTASIYASTGGRGQIYGLNLEGDDPQLVKLSIPWVRPSCIWNGGILASDEKSVVWWPGGAEHNLKWASEREYATNRDYAIKAFGPRGKQFFAYVQEINTTDNSLTRHCIEMYDLDIEEWFQVSPWVTSTVATLQPAGPMPVAAFPHAYREDTVYWADGSNWRYLINIPPGQNPFFRRDTAGGIPFDYAASGTADTPTYHFLEGMAKVVSEIWSGADLQGTDANLTIEAASQSATAMSFDGNVAATFQQRDRWNKHLAQFPKNLDAFDRLKLRITGTQGSDSVRRSPNLLPFLVRGYAFADNNVRTPIDVESWRFE